MSNIKQKTAIAKVDHGQLATHITHWTQALDKFRELQCETEADEVAWGQWLSRAQDTIKMLEDERKRLVTPFNEVVSDINADYREAREPAELFKALAKSKLDACALRRKLAADAAHEAMRLAAQAGDSDGVYEALALVPETVKVQGAATKFEWIAYDCDVTEMDSKFLQPDEKALKEYIKAFGGERPATIAGVKFKQVAKTTARGTRK